MKLKEILALCTEELKTLEGAKFKSVTEFHSLKEVKDVKLDLQVK